MRIEKITLVLGIMLMLSLAGNLFMGGVLMGKGYSQKGQVSGERGEISERLMQKEKDLREKLSQADLDILNKDMETHRASFKNMREDLEAARDAVRHAMDAEPFDQQALDIALAAEQEIKNEILKTMRAAREATVKRLSTEGQNVLRRAGHQFGGDKIGDRNSERAKRWREWREKRMEQRRQLQEGQPASGSGDVLPSTIDPFVSPPPSQPVDETPSQTLPPSAIGAP